MYNFEIGLITGALTALAVYWILAKRRHNKPPVVTFDIAPPKGSQVTLKREYRAGPETWTGKTVIGTKAPDCVDLPQFIKDLSTEQNK